MKRLLLFLALVCPALAATFNSDGSRADVQAQIDLAADGDTVTIPAGSFTWNATVSITGRGIHLRGAASDRVVARSDTELPVATGTKVFTLLTEWQTSFEDLKGRIVAGQTMRIYRGGGEVDADVAGSFPFTTGLIPWMEGTVTTYVGTTLTMNITSTNDPGSGNHGPWIVVHKPANRTEIVMDVSESDIALSVADRVGRSVEISNLTFTHTNEAYVNSEEYIRLSFVASAEPTFIHDCSFSGKPGDMTFIKARSPRGIIWNTSFYFLPGSASGNTLSASDQDNNYTNSWGRTSTMGTADTTGKGNLYIEDCDIHFNTDSIDGSDNARLVIRNNLMNNSGLGMHGADTGTWGVRHFEIYDNKFILSNPFGDGHHVYPVQGWLVPRGGTGVFTSNIVDDITSWGAGDAAEIGLQAQMLTRVGSTNSGWGSNNDTAITSITQANPTVITSTSHGLTTGDYTRITSSNSTPSVDGRRQVTMLTANTFTVAVNVTVSGNTGKTNRIDYYAPRQIGYGYVTGLGQTGWTGDPLDDEDAYGYVGDIEPLYIWGNTGTVVIGVDDSNIQGVTDPDLASDYILLGRDYFNGTAKPGWTKWTPVTGGNRYPHPLRNSADSGMTVQGTTTVSGSLTLPP